MQTLTELDEKAKGRVLGKKIEEKEAKKAPPDEAV